MSWAADPVALSWAAEQATFARDGWIASCVAGACRASLASDSHAEALLIGRFAGSDGISIGLATPHGIADRDRSIDVRVDDKSIITLRPGHDYGALERVESFWLVDTGVANSLFQAMLKAKRLRLSYLDMVGAPHDADFSLDAFEGLLDFIRHQQNPPQALATGVAPPAAVPENDHSRHRPIVGECNPLRDPLLGLRHRRLLSTLGDRNGRDRRHHAALFRALRPQFWLEGIRSPL
jgi:hypothetical protein